MPVAKIDTASSGDNTIVAAPTSPSHVRVTSITLLAVTAVTVQWWDGPSASGTARSGVISLGATGGYTVTNLDGLFGTTAGNNLVLKLGGNVQVSGHITYALIPPL